MGAKVSGGVLKELRRGEMLSQAELARKAGLSIYTAQQIEWGNIENPHFSTVRKLAEALGVDPRDLLEGEVGPKERRPRPSKRKTQIELIEDRLSQYQERQERSDVRWLKLHGVALVMLEKTRQRDLRKRYKEVAQRAFDGYLHLLGPDPDIEGLLDKEPAEVA